MPSFGSSSRRQLQTCDQRLRKVFEEVLRKFDCTVLCGYRNEEDQNKAYDQGRSKVRYPHGKHNTNPSRAVDVAPYPIDWENLDRFYYFAGYVMNEARNQGIRLRWGGDWDSDTEVTDNDFNDLVHFELVE
jgi:peptidoglycan LD-endopeptidase CwlK